MEDLTGAALVAAPDSLVALRIDFFGAYPCSRDSDLGYRRDRLPADA